MAKRPQNNRRKILDAALDCAAEARWGDVSLSKIAKEADVSLKQLYAEFASKADIVAAIIVQTTTSVVEGTDPSAADEPAHDRLLDAILRRFDALAPHKAAVTSILRDMPLDPLTSLRLMPNYFDAMAWVLESAGISSTGLAGRIRTKGLAVINLAAMGIWIRDDTADLTKTMAFLDRRLKQAVQVAAFLPFGVVNRTADKAD
ncbi:MAG: hypothetical protein CMM52_11940 [Rhodospirillaceae bacterium]|nr:hypothetical protein [Rhodospirillaceae bacterium]|tara:strand:+ start:9642 stop:10250 length:609 start_codon:yes stop_codon:yes gene_type:complete